MPAPLGCEVARIRWGGSIVFLLEVAGVGELVTLLVDVRERNIVVELFVFAFRMPFPAAISLQHVHVAAAVGLVGSADTESDCRCGGGGGSLLLLLSSPFSSS